MGTQLNKKKKNKKKKKKTKKKTKKKKKKNKQKKKKKNKKKQKNKQTKKKKKKKKKKQAESKLVWCSSINAYGLVSLSMRQNTETLPTFLWHCLGLDVNIIKNIRT